MRFIQKGDYYILRLQKGEEIVGVLAQFFSSQRISSGWINGLGGLSGVTLGYFDQLKQQYNWRDFAGNLELTQLTGNVAIMDEKPIMHLHATVADETLRAVGGHVKSAVVGGTVEIYVSTLEIMQLSRKKDEATGLNVLDL